MHDPYTHGAHGQNIRRSRPFPSSIGYEVPRIFLTAPLSSAAVGCPYDQGERLLRYGKLATSSDQGAPLSHRLWRLWTCGQGAQGGMQVEAAMALPPLGERLHCRWGSPTLVHQKRGRALLSCQTTRRAWKRARSVLKQR